MHIPFTEMENEAAAPSEECADTRVPRPKEKRTIRGADYDTNNDTNQDGRDEQMPQVIENMVELVRDRNVPVL